MKTFGKFLLGLGAFSAGMYAGAFISAFVAEKVMDSPLDESVLRKHANPNSNSKLDYWVYKKPEGWDNIGSVGKEDSDEDDSYNDNDYIFADYKGSVKTFDDLPKEPDIGDYFFVEDADNGKGCIYMYTKNDGYVIPKIADGVSLNDLFTFKKDAPQDDIDSTDTDSDTVPTYYEFASDESDDDESTYYDSLLAFLNDLNELYSTGDKVHIKMKDGVVLRYVRNDDGWVVDPLLSDPKHISGIFYGDINLVDFHHYTFHEGDIILNIPFVENASEKAKLYKWHNGEVTNSGIMIDRRDEDDTATEESNS